MADTLDEPPLLCGNDEGENSTLELTTEDFSLLTGEQGQALALQQALGKSSSKKESQFNFVNKSLRAAGESYTGRKKNPGDGTTSHVTKPAKKPLQPCNVSSTCRSGKGVFKCKIITDQDREAISTQYWNLHSWLARKTFVKSQVEVRDAKRRSGGSRVGKAMQYFLKTQDGKRLRVCKTMFTSTLPINHGTLHQWVTESSEQQGTKEFPKRAAPRPLAGAKKKKLYAFFSSLPKMESHYCRQETGKLFLDSRWKSVARLYQRGYKKRVPKQDTVSLRTFRRVFKELKLGIHTLRKDTCNNCEEMRLKGEDVTSSDHFIEQKAAISEKREFKILLKEDVRLKFTECFIMDVESALPLPKLFVRLTFYKTKLSYHNLTVYNLRTKEVDCYCFCESQAGCTANVYSSLILKKLNSTMIEKPETKHIVFYSDSCSAQNKNQTLSNMLLHFARTMNIIITQRFLVVGHTHMECDSFHSLIERATRNHRIYSPKGYLEAMVSCRDVEGELPSVTVHDLKYSDFLEFHYQYVKSIRPGSRVGDPTVTAVRSYEYHPTGKILYKMSLKDEFKPLPGAFKLGPFPPPSPLYSKPQDIPESKKKDLRDQMPYVPPEEQEYYKEMLQ